MTNFDNHQTVSAVIAIISQTLKIPVSQIDQTATFEQLGVDSLDAFEIIMKLEETFGVEIQDQQAAEILSVQQAIDAMHSSRTK